MQTANHAREQRAKDRSWLRHIGLLNDYVRIPYANGSSFATQFLYREFRARGYEATVVGPTDPAATPEEMPASHLCLPSLPLRNHPGVFLPLPTRRSLAKVAAERFDVVLANSGSELVDLGVWLRATQHVPFLSVNTIHLPSTYNVLLPDSLSENKIANQLFLEHIVPWAERHSAQIYNQTDGMVVLSRGLEQYWRDRGVTAPIHVIPRSVDPGIFDRPAGEDPFDPRADRGYRLLCVCRHTREKSVTRLIETFARHIAPDTPRATLTLVGDGPDHDTFRAQAQALGVADRVFFPGEFELTEIPRFYRHADVFLYMSLSETYGQVVSEAAWCGMPVVAFADDKGVSHQIDHGVTGMLVQPGPDADAANREFARLTVELLEHRMLRLRLSERAQQVTRLRTHPSQCMDRYLEAFAIAREHCKASLGTRLSQPLAPMRSLGRWAAVQTTLAALGCVRSPATVNRHGRRPPGWHDIEASFASNVRGGQGLSADATPRAIA